MNQPPFGVIADLLKKGRVIPFLGAGVNLGARPKNFEWAPSCPYAPSGSELALFLARESNFPLNNERDRKDLAKVASYYVESVDRGVLREKLRELFVKQYAACSIHTYLASLQTPLLVVTTNYDTVLERAFTAAGRPFDLVVHPTDRKDIEASILWWPHGSEEPEIVPPNRLAIDLNTTTVIYKMHGTVRQEAHSWDSYVITEDDYIDFLSRMTAQVAVPATFMHHFRSRHFLFLGYGLQDWNFRVLLNNMRAVLSHRSADDARPDRPDPPRSWAIQRSPSPLEKELWNTRKVNIYAMKLEDLVPRLQAGR